MSKSRLLFVALFVCLLGLSLNVVKSQEKTETVRTPPGQQTSTEIISRGELFKRTFGELSVQAQNDGSARVIVGLRLSFQPEGRLNQAAVLAQRRAIAQTQTAILARLPAAQVRSVKRYIFIPFMAFEIDAAGLELLRTLPEVASIEEDRLQRASLAESVPLIGAPAAWASGFAGAGQAVAILDTGVDKTHPFLTGKVVSEACYSTSGSLTTTVCPGGLSRSTDAGSGVNCSAPGCEHGTHVAGIAAGKSSAFSGVARDANIVAIQVFSRITNCSNSVDCTVAFNSDVLSGLQRVQELSSSLKIAAVNLSLGGGGSSINCDASDQSYKAAIDNLRSLGVATVVASGNSGNPSGLSSPACVSSAISVGSTGDGSNGSTVDAVSSFSDSATFLSLLAPGEWINSSIPGGNFEQFRGTSMSAPHVAGAYAILKSKLPQASVSQIQQALADTGLAINDPRNGVAKPRIRVDAAANALGTTACTYSLAPANLSFTRTGGTGTVNLTAAGGCPWTAKSNVPWITINGAGSGAGNGPINITVAANNGFERSGTLLIGGQVFEVKQASAPAAALDDGTFENAIGLRFGGTMCAVNRLTPPSYPAAIDTVGVHFQSLFGLPLNKDITVLYGLNPSGSGDLTAVTLQSTPGKVKGWDQFNTYSIPPQVATSGDFVVGFCVQHASGELPVEIDQTPPSQRRSLLSLNGGAYQLVDSISSSFAGNFGIRGLLTSKYVLAAGSVIAAEGCATANQSVDPGENVTINFSLRNIGTEPLGNLTATLETSGGVSGPSGPQTYGAMPANGPPVAKSFSFTANGSCGNVATATLRLQDGATDLGAASFALPLGAPVQFSATNNYSSSGAPVPIPDNGSVEVPITINDTGFITDVNVRVRLNHPSDADLDLSLVAPDGTSIDLSTDNGGFNANYGSGSNDCSGTFTVFDDSAPTPIISGVAPFAAVYKPEGSLTVLNGKAINGVWKLRIVDDLGGFAGTLGCWQLEIARRQAVCCGSTCPVIANVSPATSVVGSQITLNGQNFTGVSSVKFANNVTANFTVVSPTQITATVPFGAKPGAITISKSGCLDFQIDFTTLTLEITPGGPVTLSNEECGTPNNVIDPGERVTVFFPLKNVGTGATTNLTATLQAASGVVQPSGPQTYGALSAGSAATLRPFTFTAGAACGGVVTATLQLQDGATSVGTVSFLLTTGQRVIFAESFDRVSAPVLPTGWVATGNPVWTTSSATSDSPPNNAFASNPSTTADLKLDSPNIAITSAQAELSFRNSYNLQTSSTSATDGAVLEIALGSDPFTDIIAAGGSFVAGGYNKTIFSFVTNPLAGRQAWSGDSGGYLTTTVKLPATAAGKNIKLRWRLGSDSSGGAPGWRIDGITLSEIVCNNNCGPICHSVSNLNPTSGLVGSTVTITGAELTGVAGVKFGGNVSAQFNVLSNTQLTAVVPPGATSGPIVISKSGCPDAMTAVFTVLNPQPTLTSLNPTSAVAGGAAFTLTVNGANFINGSVVRVNGGGKTTAFVSSSQLTTTIAVADIAAAGSVSVTVFNPAPGGGESAIRTLAINNPAPTLNNLSPASIIAGGAGFTLTVNGANFINGSVVRVNGSGKSTAFVNSTQLTTTIAAADIATAGSFNVTVFNPAPGGGESAIRPLAIENPIPTISSLSPNAKTAGDAGFTLTVNGTNFVNTSVVRWKNIDRVTTFVNSTQLTAAIPAGDIASDGAASVTVFNPAPGGGVSNAQSFTIIKPNPAPVMTNLSPNPVIAGGQGFTLTVNGKDFISGSTVKWNGNDRATSFVSSTQLTAAISATDIATAGVGRITVFTAAPGGGASNETILTIANTLANVPAASFSGSMLAPDSIVAAFGVKLATTIKAAPSTPLPTELEGTQVKVIDSAGAERLAPLFFISPTQINYLMPSSTAPGAATVMVVSGDGSISVGAVTIMTVAPALFTANSSGQGIAAGVLLRVKANNDQSYEPIAVFDQAQNMYIAKPIDFGEPSDQLFLILYGGGIRYRSALSAVTVTIGGLSQQVLFAGAQTDFVGLDQVNVGLSRDLAGRGEVDVVMTVDGKPANTVKVSFR